MIAPHSRRTFVERVDFVTTVARGAAVITDLGVLEPDPESKELTLTHVHPGSDAEQARAATGWALRVAGDLSETRPPSARELDVLRSLKTKGQT